MPSNASLISPEMISGPIHPSKRKIVLVLVLLLLPSIMEPADHPPSSSPAISRKVPKKPMSDQARPPCTQRGAVEINGGCWRVPRHAETAPCEEDLYEHEGRCYVLIRASERPRTSAPL